MCTGRIFLMNRKATNYQGDTIEDGFLPGSASMQAIT